MFESSWPGPRFPQPGGTQLRTLPIASHRFVFERREPEDSDRGTRRTRPPTRGCGLSTRALALPAVSESIKAGLTPKVGRQKDSRPRQSQTRAVPLGLRPPTAPSVLHAGRRKPPTQPLGGRHLRPCPRQRRQPHPRHPHPRPRLEPDHLATPARPRHLRPPATHRTATPYRSQRLTRGSTGSTSVTMRRSQLGLRQTCPREMSRSRQI